MTGLHPGRWRWLLSWYRALWRRDFLEEVNSRDRGCQLRHVPRRKGIRDRRGSLKDEVGNDPQRRKRSPRKGYFQASHFECVMRSFNPTKTSEAYGRTPVLYMSENACFRSQILTDADLNEGHLGR